MQPRVMATVDPVQLERLRNGLRIMALRALSDADQAEDVVQESLLRALNSVTPEIATDAARLGAFVGGIARHVIADIRRRELKFTSLPAALPAGTAEDALSRLVKAEEHAAIHQALAALSPRDRAVLRDSFFRGLSPAQVAAASGEPAERVRKRKSRALERLRAALASVGHEAAIPSSSNSRPMLQPVLEGGQ